MRCAVWYLIMLPMVACWQRVTFRTGGKIQHLSVKNEGKHIHYFDARDNAIMSIINNSRIQVTRRKFVVDTDIEKWNETIYNMVAYYDPVDEFYRVSDTDFCSASPVKRCLFVSRPYYSLSRLIFAQDGRWTNITTTIEGDRMQRFAILPFHICHVEYYPPHIYIVDSLYTIHILHANGTLVTLTDVHSQSPIIHLHVYSKVVARLKMTIGFMNGTVAQWDLSDRTATPVCHFVTERMLKVYADSRKILIVTDQGDVLVYDPAGTFLHRIRSVCDPDYVTRLYGSATCFIVDGTDDIIVYRQREQDRQKVSGFLAALMKTPVFRIEHLRGNWSADNMVHENPE